MSPLHEPGAQRLERLFVALAQRARLETSFAVSDFIGRGTYGHVYRATVAGGSQCAVKLFLSPHTSLDSVRRELTCLVTLGCAGCARASLWCRTRAYDHCLRELIASDPLRSSLAQARLRAEPQLVSAPRMRSAT